MRRAFTLSLALVATGLALGLSARAAELRVGLRANGESMDPHYSSVGSNIGSAKNVFDPLVGIDDKLQPVPGLALSWAMTDPTTWRVKLRPNVKFHDGAAFGANDVVHSLDRIRKSPGPDGGLVPFLRRIASATAVDDLTVDFKTDGPTATLPIDLTRLLVIPASTPVGAAPADFNAGRYAIGTGPYKLVSFAPRGDMVLEPFADYWGPKSPWTKVTFTEISNDSARVAALLSDRVDLINALPAADVDRLKRTNGLSVYESPGIFIFFLFTDYRQPTPTVTGNDGQPLPENPFRNPKVRQAISAAIARDALASRVMEGSATPANQFLVKGFTGYVDDLPPIAVDVERAKALMAEAGYPNGFKVALHCTSDRLPKDGAVCAALAPMLARIGITASVNATPRAVYIPAQAAGSYSLMMNGFSTPTGEGSYFLTTAIHTRDKDRGFGGFNHWYHADPVLDAVIEEAAASLDEGKRRALLEQGTRMVMERSAVIPLVTLNVLWGAKANLAFAPRVDEETPAANVRPR